MTKKEVLEQAERIQDMIREAKPEDYPIIINTCYNLFETMLDDEKIKEIKKKTPRRTWRDNLHK